MAPAKINLALHVTGQRTDGYHELDTLVGFADFGDRLTFESAPNVSLTIGGPEGAGLLGGSNNLIIAAAHGLRDLALGHGFSVKGAAIHLDKQLPVASGIGGGSADAAATILGLIDLWKLDLPAASISALGLLLGADVPMCLKGEPLRARGIGDELEAVTLPQWPIVLLNPRRAVSTPDVFSRLQEKNHAGLGDVSLGAGDMLNWLRNQRNDLQSAAVDLVPDIQSCLLGLEKQGSQLARMSGSGATCFGLFESQKMAESAAANISKKNAGWWVRAGALKASVATTA